MNAEDELELRKMKSKARKREKVFIQMVINDYICKGLDGKFTKKILDSGAMTMDRDKQNIGLKTTTNYNLMVLKRIL